MKKHKIAFADDITTMTCALITASDEIRLLVEYINHPDKKLKIWAFDNLQHLMN